MPYIELQHTDAAAARRIAPALAQVIARALGLEPGDVLVGVVTQASLCDGHGEIQPWPAAIFFGRDREPAVMVRAQEDAIDLLARGLDVSPERVFVHWAVSAPPE